MGPYSHILIASELERHVRPDNLQDYYWGAVVPDIRYLVAGMPRSKTHLPIQKILDYQVQYPQLEAFLQGYLVHCLSDNLNLPDIIQQVFPFTLQKKKLSGRHGSVILEFFNIERIKSRPWNLSGVNNLILRELGVRGEDTTRFVKVINRYINHPSLEASVLLYQNLGLVGDDRIKKYWAAIERFQKNWFQKRLILFGLQVGQVNREIAALVKLALPVM